MSTLDRINDTEFAGQTSETVGGFFVQDEGGKLLINRFQEDKHRLQNYYSMRQTQVVQMMVFKLQRRMLVIV